MDGIAWATLLTVILKGTAVYLQNKEKSA